MQKTTEKNAKQRYNLNNGLHLIAIVLIAIIMISSSIGLYAWARYKSILNENPTTAQVAKWYFNLKTGEYSPDGPQLLYLTRTDNHSHVVEGKLAPGTSGVLPIIVDTTGTETDLTYDVIITINNCPQNIVFTPQTPASTTQIVSGEGTNDSPRVLTIRIQKYIPYSQTGEHDETITWNWPYQTGTGNEIMTNDITDTIDSGKEVTVTITAVGTEVLEEPQVRLSEMTLKSTSSSVALETGKTAQIEFEDVDSVYGTESLTYTSNDESVATVSSTGLVTAQGKGTTTITIEGRDSTKTVPVSVTLGLGATINYTTTLNGQTLDNWKLFYNDTENDKVYLIYGDYLPNSYLKDENGDSVIPNLSFINNYAVKSDSKDNLIIAMTTRANWSSLLKGSIDEGEEFDYSSTDYAGTYDAMGSPKLYLYVQSWNKKYPNNETYTTNQIYIKAKYFGYNISRINNPPTEQSVNMSGSEGYIDSSNADSLYYPHTARWEATDGYWLATSARSAIDFTMIVSCTGEVSQTNYGSSLYAFRPVVCLPSSVLE